MVAARLGFSQMRRPGLLMIGVICASLLSEPLAEAQAVGIVGGGSVDPEQFFIGSFFETPPLAERVRVRPGVDGAWGSGLKLASINLDIIYRAEVGTGWQFYTGGGPLIVIARVDESEPVTVRDRLVEDDVTGGLGALLGFSHSSGFFTEFRFGRVRYAPSLKFGVGFRIG